MKLIGISTLFTLLASGANAAGDHEVNRANLRPRRLLSNHMWMFGENGVQIYSPDGSSLVKSVEPDRVCKNVTSSSGSSRIRCDFSDVVSDGNKYVWATVARGVPKVDVFRIDTGDLVGSFGTCGSPGELDFHPLREEIWVHCSGYSDVSESHMDVFSTASPSAPIPSTVTLHDNTALRSFGKMEVHASLGDYAYSTVYGQPTLYKIDLAERRVAEEYDMGSGNPNLYGIYDMTYSPINGHIFTRSEVCCTCGFEGADNLECGRYGSYNITVGNMTVEGQCGRHCQGGPSDTIGVFEFDTHSDTLVGTHQFAGSAPVYKPFASPDGRHIVFFGLDGGRTVQILKPGEPGQLSETEHILKLDFNVTNNEDYGAFSDFAYIQTKDMNLFVVSSTYDYKVAIIDMDTLGVSYVTLKDAFVEGKARSRQVEWAEGTPYVWIGSTSDDEVHVVNIETKTLVKTFTDVDPRKLLSVTPHHFMGMANEYGNYFADMNIASMGDSSSSAATTASTNEIQEIQSMTMEDDMSEDDVGGNSLSAVALALSCVAIVAVVASFFVKSSAEMKQATSAQETSPLAGKKLDDPSLAVPPSVA